MFGQEPTEPDIATPSRPTAASIISVTTRSTRIQTQRGMYLHQLNKKLFHANMRVKRAG